MFKRLTFLPLVAALALAGCADESTPTAVEAPIAEGRYDNEGRASEPTIAETAEAAGFSLLLAAVNHIAATNPGSPVVAKLLDNSQYTVFAPTDQAFLDLVGAVSGLVDPDVLANDGPFAAIDDLLGAGTVEAVVAYHITEGRRKSNSVVPPRRARMIRTLLKGASFSVDRDANITAVGNSANFAEDMDGAPLIDISASNGVIHVIDAVILPIDLGL